MSQNDLSIANQGFASFRSDLNSALQALGSTNSGTSAPSTTYANQLFYDTTNNILKIRNEDNDAFISLFTLDQTNDNIESLTINGAFACEGFTSNGIDDNSSATAITVSEADKVLIGTTTTNWSGSSTLIVKEASGDGGISIVSASTSNNGNIGFADTEGNDFANMRGLISYLHSDDAFRFMTANSEKLRLTSDGRLGINDSAPNRLLQIKATGTGDTQKATIMFENEVGTTGSIGQGDTSNNAMIFTENGSERMRLDTNGNLLFNLSSRLFADASSTINASVESNSVLRVNRATTDGTIVDFGKDGTVVGKISSIGGERISIHSGTVGLEFNPSNQINPSNGSGGVDNTLDLGASGSRFDDIFATNGTIQTSDKNEKQDIEELTDAEKRVAVVAKGLMRKYRWKDAVAEKGDKARTHFGIIAQDLEDAFKAEGLDANKYAMFCSDTWTNDDGKEQTRLGIRYPQLLAFIITAI